MPLADFARVRLAHTPTPLEPLENLTRRLGAPRLFVKRDDCTGLAMGGNKARQLEFYFGEALARGADTVIITGAVQSNFLRMTAAAAAKLGLACEIQHEDRVPGMGAEYHGSGNAFLDRLFGAVVHGYPQGEDEAGADAALEAIAEQVRTRDGRPYVVPLGEAHPPLGALGYVDAARELVAQFTDAAIEPDAIVLPTGSALTHAGLLVGLRLLGSTLRVCGICVRRGRDAQTARVRRRAAETAALIGHQGLVTGDDVWVEDDVLAPGYGRVNDQTVAAIRLAAREEGLLVDPVYSGKALAGLIALVRRGAFTPDATVVFLHTGGTPALFGYRDIFD
ncbi:MAG: D-cysteine desulfhydrase family protein [Alphaproteobacteria bacterium]